MSFADYAALAADGNFQVRRDVCIYQEGKKFAADGRPDIAALAVDVLTTGTPGALLQAVNTAPGFDTTYASGGQEAITDGDLLSATDAVWPDVAALLHPQPAP